MSTDKRDIRSLPLTDGEFEANFFLDPKYSTKRKERWVGSAKALGMAVPRQDTTRRFTALRKRLQGI